MKMMITLFGLVSYLIGMAGLVVFLLWIGSWSFLPFHINSGIAGDTLTAVGINLGIMFLFGLHHSVAARPGFKASLTKIVPRAAERSSYVLMSGLMMVAIVLLWQPLPGIVWQFENELVKQMLIVGYMAGWLISVVASFMINHFELFGLQQVYLNQTGRVKPEESFTTRGLYGLVRHPIQLGIFIGIWSTPLMTMTHFMLAATMTVYIFIGLYFEEKDLARTIGNEYEVYRRRVRKLLPIPAGESDTPHVL